MTINVMLRTLDRLVDELIEKLECADAKTFDETIVISHWQGNGFRLQITRRSDGKSLTRFVREDGTVLP